MPQIAGSRYTSEYLAWKNMKARCDNPNTTQYANYGGRGITYDPRWRLFANFYMDMGECPVGLTLDREDNDGDYYKDNCRWASRSVQRQNQRPQLEKVVAHNTSGITGVSWCERDTRWISYFTQNYKQIRLYSGYDLLQACAARKSWEAKVRRGEL